MNLQLIGEWLAILCFGYPFVMAFYWMVGGLLFHLVRERHEPAQDQPPELEEYPPVSVLVPCFNEERQAEETFGILARLQYPNYEIIAINDGSKDGTAALLEDLALAHSANAGGPSAHQSGKVRRTQRRGIGSAP